MVQSKERKMPPLYFTMSQRGRKITTPTTACFMSALCFHGKEAVIKRLHWPYATHWPLVQNKITSWFKPRSSAHFIDSTTSRLTSSNGTSLCAGLSASSPSLYPSSPFSILFKHGKAAKSCRTLLCTLPTATCQDAGGPRRRRLWIIWFVILKHSTARRGKPFNHPSHIRQQLRFIRDSHTEPFLPPFSLALLGRRPVARVWETAHVNLLLINPSRVNECQLGT